MSAQTMAEVHAPAEAHYKNMVIHETWGHLFPTGIYYEGIVRIASSVYASFGGILDEQIAISSSPWWYDAITDFAYEVTEDMESGEVADFKIAVTIQTSETDKPWYWDEDEDGVYVPDTFQTINIRLQQKIVIARGY